MIKRHNKYFAPSPHFGYDSFLYKAEKIEGTDSENLIHNNSCFYSEAYLKLKTINLHFKFGAKS